jgi:hypothetical protein
MQHLKEMMEQYHFTVWEWRYEEDHAGGMTLHRAAFYFNGVAVPVGSSGWQPSKKAAREEAAFFAIPTVSGYLQKLYR